MNRISQVMVKERVAIMLGYLWITNSNFYVLTMVYFISTVALNIILRIQICMPKSKTYTGTFIWIETSLRTM